MRDRVGWVGGRTEGESNERDVLMWSILGSGRNLVPGNLQESTRMITAKSLNNSGEGA